MFRRASHRENLPKPPASSRELSKCTGPRQKNRIGSSSSSPVLPIERQDMFSIIGIVVVFGAVIGGFLMEKGKMPVLVQPAELIIIGGSALGTLLVANPLPLIIKIFKSVLGVISGSPFNRESYTGKPQDALRHFPVRPQERHGQTGRRYRGSGEKRRLFEVPEAGEGSPHSQLHLRHSAHCRRRASLPLTIWTPWSRRISTSTITPARRLFAPLTTVADALPGLGIVAAVLGIVITMGALGWTARTDR